NGALLDINGPVAFGVCSRAHIEANEGASVLANSSYDIDGNAAYHLLLSSTAGYRLADKTITMVGSRTFTQFVRLQNRAGATIYLLNKVGSATGVRYYADTNSVINTYGGGANYLFGDSNGSTATGAQYV